MRLLLATSNAHKVRELAAALPGWTVEGFDPPEPAPPETGATYRDNALIKARHARRFAARDTWVAGEDSGVEIDALRGAPGLRSARWAGDGVGAALSALEGVDDRRARYVCELVALGPDGEVAHGRGTLPGAIARAPSGSEGFGYDPVFVPDGESSTVAELGDAWKARRSHRARAAQALRAELEVDPGVRELALEQSRQLPPPLPPLELVRGDGWSALVLPDLVGVSDVALGVPDLPAAVGAARALARRRDRSRVVWFATPLSRPVSLATELRALGLVPADEPGQERVTAGMVLLCPPPGEEPGVTVEVIDSFERFLEHQRIVHEAFGFPEDVRALERSLAPELWASLRDDRHRVAFLTRIDGEAVAAASAVEGRSGLFLHDGCTLPRARGRGAYRALVRARWDEAVRRGKPALAVGAGPQSQPILERLGFRWVGEVEWLLDRLD